MSVGQDPSPKTLWDKLTAALASTHQQQSPTAPADRSVDKTLLEARCLIVL